MPAAGLDISDKSVHFIELQESKDGFVVSNFGEKSIPLNVIEGGDIKNAGELIKVLFAIKEELRAPFVNVSLPEERAYLFTSRIPAMKKSEIRSSVELQIEDNVPIAARDAIFDYDIVNERVPDGGQIEVELSVFPRGIIERYLEALKDAELRPLSLEIEAQAIARSVIPEGDLGTYMIMDFGKTRTGISVVSEGTTRFTSTLDIGGGALTKTIEQTLKVSSEKAEEMKKEKGVIRREENEDLFLSMMSLLGVLKEEVNKNYVYWHTHKDPYGKKRPRIEKIILCGGDANLIGLPELLSSGLRVPVERANVMANVNSFERYIPEIDFNQSLHFATAIGLALRAFE